MTMTPATLLPAVEAISRHAGAEIMALYGRAAVQTKDDGSLVTEADHAAENVILPALAQLAPGVPILSEEAFAKGSAPDISGGTFWVVDPLDGTREFVRRTGAFVVAIALVKDFQPVLGVVYHPAMDVLYSGAGPGTAAKTVGQHRGALPTQAEVTDSPRILVNAPHTDMERVAKWLSRRFNNASSFVDVRSSVLRACQVADGVADMAVVCSRHQGQGRTYWWDVAPGHAVINAAGGRLETFDGQPLRYDSPDYRVGPHICVSPAQHAARPVSVPVFNLHNK